MQKPYLVAWSSSFSTWLLTKVPDNHFQIWSCIRRSFGMMRLNSRMVFCAMIFIGAMQIPGIEWTLESEIGRPNPYFMSFPMSFFEESWLLWFLKAGASIRSLCCSSLLNSFNGHLLPSLRKSFIHFQSGWRPKICWRTNGGLNSLP